MLRPLHDNVVLEVEPTEEKVGGLIIPKKGEKTAVAKVVAVGPGINKDGKTVEMPVKVGDKVLDKEYSTTEYKQDETKYLVASINDILAIVE